MDETNTPGLNAARETSAHAQYGERTNAYTSTLSGQYERVTSTAGPKYRGDSQKCVVYISPIANCPACLSSNCALQAYLSGQG